MTGDSVENDWSVRAEAFPAGMRLQGILWRRSGRVMNAENAHGGLLRLVEVDHRLTVHRNRDLRNRPDGYVVFSASAIAENDEQRLARLILARRVDTPFRSANSGKPRHFPRRSPDTLTMSIFLP
jgi:hypothetical protein